MHLCIHFINYLIKYNALLRCVSMEQREEVIAELNAKQFDVINVI